MPTYIGFSTKDICKQKPLIRPGVDGGIGNVVEQAKLGKKFRLVDNNLVVQDLLNALSIKQGDKVGQPKYGTTLWEFIFDPNTFELRAQIENEIRRVASLDPRLTIGSIDVFNRENGVLIELEISITPYNNVVQVGFFLNRFNSSIQQLNQ